MKSKLRSFKTNSTNDSGFTLLELLLATTIIGLVLTAVFGSVFVGVRAYKSAQEDLAYFQEKNAVTNTLADDLANAFPSSIRTEPTEILLARPTDRGPRYIRWNIEGSGAGLCRTESGMPVESGQIQLMSSKGPSPIETNYFQRVTRFNIETETNALRVLVSFDHTETKEFEWSLGSGAP